MRFFDRLRISSKLIASFGLAMVLVLATLGGVTYYTFADALQGAQARIAQLNAERVLDLLTRPQAAAPAATIQALGIAPEIGLLLDPGGAGAWTVAQAGQIDPAQVQQRLAAPPAPASAAAGGPMRDLGAYWVYSAATAPGAPRLHYVVPRALHLAAVTALKNRIIAATLIVAWVAGWVVLIIAHRLSRPVQALSSAMATAEQADNPLPASLLQRGDEIGELARSFDSLRARIRLLIHVDALTGAYNRRYVTAQLLAEMERSATQPGSAACLLIDLDYFKSVNDSLGHPCGDQALKHAATVLQSMVGPADVAARYGGEEFLVLLPDSSRPAAAAMAERLRRGLETSPLLWAGQRVELTMSVGLGFVDAALREQARQSPVQAAAKLVEQADQALYEAKRLGRNRVVLRGEDGRFSVVSGRGRRAQPVAAAA